MEQPPKFVTKGESSMAYKLKKVIYGLKQSTQAWFDKLSGVIESLSFECCHSNHSMFVKHTCYHYYCYLCGWYYCLWQ